MVEFIESKRRKHPRNELNRLAGLVVILAYIAAPVFVVQFFYVLYKAITLTY